MTTVTSSPGSAAGPTITRTAFARPANGRKRSRRHDCSATNEGSTFLIDYLAGVDAAAEFLVTNEEEQFVFPAPAYAEVLVGEGNAPDGDVDEAKADLSWGEVYETDKETAELAGQIADELGPQGPFLAGMDGLIAAVGRELGASVVSFDEDLTHEETKKVIEVEEYR